MIENLSALDNNNLDYAISLFAYRLLNYEDAISDEEHPFFILGLIALLVKNKPNQHAEIISELVIWLVEDEKYFQSINTKNKNQHNKWLLNVTSFDSYAHKWRNLGAELVKLSEQASEADWTSHVAAIGLLLAE